MSELSGIAESISLETLLNHDILQEALRSLSFESPLRMVLENDSRYKILRSVRDNYPNQENYHYAHGIAAVPRGLGYGTRLFAERIRRVVRKDDLMFGFVMASPINIPSIRMYLRQDAVIDKVEENAYEHGKTYFRLIYAKTIKTDLKDSKTFTLEDDYINQIKSLTAKGYIATRFEQPNSLVFNKRL